MPVGVVTNDREEHKWERAKQIAKDEGHDGDWKYVMGIYKRMNPSRFNKKASLAMYLLKSAVLATETPEERAAKYPRIANLQKTINVGNNATPEQWQAAQNQWNNTYNARYNNIATPSQMSRWQAKGKTQDQIYSYVNGQVMKSMARDGLNRPLSPGMAADTSAVAGYIKPITPPASPAVAAAPRPSTPTPAPPRPSAPTPSTTASSYGAPTTPPSSYAGGPSITTTKTGPSSYTRTTSFIVPPILASPKGMPATPRSSKDIRSSVKDMSSKYRQPNFTWDSASGKYNFTGRGSGYTESQMELARLRNIYNTLSTSERAKYQNVYDQRVAALRAYDPRRRGM